MEYVGYLVEHDTLVGNAAVDAIGAAEERRDALNVAGEGDGRIASNSNPRTINGMSRQQASALLILGRELLLMMKFLVVSLLMLCACVAIFIMKK